MEQLQNQIKFSPSLLFDVYMFDSLIGKFMKKDGPWKN